MLIDTDVPQFEIPYALIGGVTAASGAFVFLVVGMLLRSRRRPVVSGREELIGAPGEALEDIEGEGWARVHGERWRVRTLAPLKRGQALRVAAIDGLVLEVTRAPEDSTGR
jgi:membrane-bound serine protease (ClpP class)